MADLFISYSREDSARAGQVAQGMMAAGFEVFWDTDVPPGQTWADYIEDKLTNCAAVIVLWSQHSTKSNWVKEEARMGRERGKLIPASLDSSVPPFGFGEVQAANLSTWNGEMQGHADWDRLVGAVQNAVARARGGEVSPPKAPAPKPMAMQPPPPLRPAASAAAAAPAQPRPAPSQQPAPATIAGVPMPVAIGVAVALLVGVGAFFFMRSQSQQQIAVAPPGVTQPAAPSVPQVAAPPPQQVQSMATFTPPSAPQQTGMTQYYQQVQARLQQVSQTLMAQGWQPVGAPYTNQLQQGQTETVPVTMNIGYSFRIVGVCDQDCGDLDLTLKDGMGGIIVQDTATDNLPVVDVLPTQAGSFSLDVLMYNCSNQPCAYGVAMFGRPN